MTTVETKKIDKKLTNKLPSNGKGSFVGDVSKIMGATAFGQVLGVISLPIITRLFTPEAFGLFGVYTAMIGILAVFVCMRYELTIVLPKDDNDAANLFWVSIAFTFFWTAFTGLIILFFRDSIASLINAPEIAPFLWLVPIGVFLTGINTTHSHWNTRRAQFGRLAGVSMVSSVVTTGSKLGAGFGGFVSGGALILASLTGTLTSSYILGRKIWKEDGGSIVSNISIARMMSLMKRYSNISIFNSTSSLFNSVSQQAPLILLAWFFNPAIVGYYLLGHKLLMIPVNLLSKSLKKVYFQRASVELNKKGYVGNITKYVTINLSLISLLLMTIMISIVAPLTSTIFGQEWMFAGKFIQWMAPWVAIGLITNSIRGNISIFQKEHILLLFHSFGFLLRVVALLIGGMLIKDAYLTIVLYSAASIIYYIFLFNWILSLSKLSVFFFIFHLKSFMVISAACITLSLYFQHLNYSMMLIIGVNIIYIVLGAAITKDYWMPIIKSKNILNL